MEQLPASFWSIFLAALPLLVVLFLMIGRQWGGERAGVVGWVVASIVAVVWFGSGLDLLLVAWGRSLLLAVYVLYIIWMALLFYHVVNEAGVVGVLREVLPAFAADPPAQALLLGWVFSSFLQGASGFGVPAAIVAPLLAGLGFGADVAVVMGLLGHAWSVTFGSLGSSFLALVAATGQAGELLAGSAASLLGVSCLLCGFGVLWLAGGLGAVRARWKMVLLLGGMMASIQWATAQLGLWTLAAFLASGIGLLVAIVYLRYEGQKQKQASFLRLSYGQGAAVLFPYGLLVLIIVVGQLFLEDLLSVVEINFFFPEVQTSYGWVVPAGMGRSISLFGHSGALLFYTSLLTFLWFRWRGTPAGKPYLAKTVLGKTIKGSSKSTIAIVMLVAMALTMQSAGMTELLAEALSHTGSLFPFLSPFIGALGAFMTGSNTNGNVLFAPLQQEAAHALQLPLALILAAQTTGGAFGGVFAPAKVILGCSTVLGANEGRVLKSAANYGLIFLILIGFLVWLFSQL